MNRQSVLLKDLIKVCKLEKVYTPENFEEIEVRSSDVNRPGLLLTGFLDYFDNDRLQVLGKVECTYLSTLTPEERHIRLEVLFSKKIPGVIITRNLYIYPELLEMAQKYQKPLLRTQERTSRFMAMLIAYLNLKMAPCVTRHGVLVDVYGEGILILGESGIGKSETAVELIKRGHQLVADDAVEIRRINQTRLVGEAPELIRHFIEIRGVGIVDVQSIFGMGNIKDSSSIDLVIQLEGWDDEKDYDRMGMEERTVKMLDVDVPLLTMPVRPGRNLAVIIEVAALNNRQKKMGYNAAKVLSDRVLNDIKDKRKS
jgi:HPr kinase/phosphorylase